MSNFRIGNGYDVHQLVNGRPLVLGGVTIPHSKGLSGHSDADVLLHAVADAILGAAALGDIGVNFPDTDQSLKGISSRTILSESYKLVQEAGYVIGNVDSTLIIQAPKISKYIPEMRQNIVEILNLELNQISIKATTTERLGFIGREEGIAAEAVVLIRQVKD